MVTIFSALAMGTALLRENGVDAPRLDSEVLLANVLGYDRLKLITERDTVLSDAQYSKICELLKLRAQGMPSAYLVEHKEFMGLDFVVAPGVLIPRGDTEILVEKVIEQCQSCQGPINIVDVGCGSGAIGVSIAKFVYNAYVTLIDIDEKALDIAELNVQKNKVEDRVKVLKGDLLSTVLNQRFDIIVSNPPYIESSLIEGLQREVRDYEPHLALDGGMDGLKFYRAITAQARECLNEGGLLAYEIGYDQAQALLDIMAGNGFGHMEILKDLAGHDRCVLGWKFKDKVVI